MDIVYPLTVDGHWDFQLDAIMNNALELLFYIFCVCLQIELHTAQN